jgi:UDP-galactopyranose mutase
MKYDWVVVGAGFTGATFAERMAAANKRVLVLDRRNHIGGNAFDAFDAQGILVHRYGPHIFHTNSDVVWNYLCSFTNWRPYEHRVLGLIEGKLVPIPFNFTSIEKLFPTPLAERLKNLLIKAYGQDKKIPILRMKDSPNGDIRAFADYVYKNVFENYTFKQWRLRPEELSPSVTARVPILIGNDDRYFQDTFQAMPASGYTALFARMLDHANIEVLLNYDIKDASREFPNSRVLYTGAIDELMDYKFGPLPYRSLRFEESHHSVVQYTRITESKIITGQKSNVTTLTFEYPTDHVPRQTVAYYPIPRDQNQDLYARYRDEAQNVFPGILLAGRLADYQYYNMDQACARSLKLASENGGPKWLP